ncbi:hypothetical protein Afil01_11500 [Actinorhabdospora filicis]|uniref:Uncharacterized protein n=1 Tax=Actinorhabdospora filicis TaxID=1785913 RepID=A0A9W6W7W3_9ACTN|nr:hypothetical protein Afil01_11500 [Actinorhabdospora filicis]
MGDLLGPLFLGGMAVLVITLMIVFRPRPRTVRRQGDHDGLNAYDSWSGAPGQNWSSGSADCGSDSGGGGGDSSC